MFKLRNKETGQIIAFVVHPGHMFNELIEVVQYLKKLHNTDVVYVYTNNKNMNYRLDNVELHALNRHARVIHSLETRGKAYQAVFNRTQIPLSLFMGFTERDIYSVLCATTRNFYTLITWDDYVRLMQEIKKHPADLTFREYIMNECNYINILTKLFI